MLWKMLESLRVVKAKVHDGNSSYTRVVGNAIFDPEASEQKPRSPLS
jgi:hypothetical protein